MYAIIRTGGHQEKVVPGERILIDRIKTEPGQTIELHPLMVSTDDGAVVSDPGELRTKGASVVGTVLEHVRGEKVDVFQYRQKTGYRRHIGHRQELTAVEISEIRLGEVRVTSDEANAAAAERQEAAAKEQEAKREAARKSREEAAQRKAEKKAAKKAPVAAKKTAAKKAPAAKKAATKKSPAKKKK